MAKRPGEPNVKVEAQPPSGYSSYFDCDTTGVAPTDQDLAEFDNFIDPSIFENNGNTDTPLQNNTRPIEAATIPGVPLASAVSSPAIPAQYFCVPFPSGETVPTEPTGWPTECIPGWSQTGSRGGNKSITDAGSWDASISDLQGYSTRETSLASPITDSGQRKYEPGWPPESLAWTRRTSITSEQSEQGFNTKNLGPSTIPKSTINPSEGPIPAKSGTSSDPPRKLACKPPESSRRASASRHAQPRQPQPQRRSPSPPPPPPRPGQRARNRTAASKSRAKTKAAHSELVATEKAESERHQELSTTFRGLQDEVLALKSELLQHGNCDDHIIQGYLNKTARQLAIDSVVNADSKTGSASSVANSGPVHLPL
ncbi:hypothetical protein SLS64_014032 [Diaporthe eres]|uniref:BZIP domain-containing protein n=1 Tax=Diaporthe eres TaxID=83184 RepID=A0ABR1NWH6_DIAER